MRERIKVFALNHLSIHLSHLLEDLLLGYLIEFLEA